MMVLACDTSGPSVSVALRRNGTIVSERTLDIGLIHSATFMPMVSDLLRETQNQPADIDLYAVTTGPGSFTGIRIGISAVKAMAYAHQKPVVGLTSLEVMAFPYHVSPGHLICPMIDARNQRAYAGAWFEGRQVIPIDNQPITAFLEAIRLQSEADNAIRGVLFITRLSLDGQTECLEPLVVRKAADSMMLPRAGVLADQAERMWEAGKAQQPEQLKATYFVKSAAERLHDKQIR